MADMHVKYGTTENGGVKTVIVFMDDDDNVVDEKEATKAYLTEYDEHDDLVYSAVLVSES